MWGIGAFSWSGACAGIERHQKGYSEWGMSSRFVISSFVSATLTLQGPGLCCKVRLQFFHRNHPPAWNRNIQVEGRTGLRSWETEPVTGRKLPFRSSPHSHWQRARMLDHWEYQFEKWAIEFTNQYHQGNTSIGRDSGEHSNWESRGSADGRLIRSKSL